MTKLNSDCLIVKIEEKIDNDIDTTLFILYDKNEEYYLVSGKRSHINGKPEPTPYKFYCKHSHELIDFINIVISKHSKINYTLLSYPDLPNYSDEIDFNYLKKLDNNLAYELAGYDELNYRKKDIMKYLRIIKNVFNYY